MIDISSLGGFESGGEGHSASAESAKESAERFAEAARKSAAQAKQDQKEERKKKQQDTTLANIIVQFLRTPQFSGFFLVVSRSLAQNIPSDFLLSILSLIHKDAYDELKKREFPNVSFSKSFIEKFPSSLAVPLGEWNMIMRSVAIAQPQKVLETVLDSSWDIDANTKQLVAMVLQEYFMFQKFDVSFESVQQFSTSFLTDLTTTLEHQIANQVLLEE